MSDHGPPAHVSRLSIWQGPVTFTRLEGGLTNLAWMAEDARGRFVVRCGEDIPLHHVFRDRERAASIAACEAGLSPEVVHAGPGVMVMRFLEARTFAEADLRREVERIAALLRRCHAEVGRRVHGPPGFFWVFHVIRDYARTLARDGGPHAARLPEFVAAADRLEAAQVAMPVVFGHHDLLPGNILDDGTRLWLIDWEYGGFGTAMFDLANLSANGAYGPDEDARLLHAYFEGRADEGVTRSFRAMKAASALREAMWAMVSERHLALPGVDYAAHARTFLDRYEELMAR